MVEPRTTMSRVCADPKTAGQKHYGCSGGICVCACHGRRVRPGELRARVEARKAERAQAQEDDR